MNARPDLGNLHVANLHSGELRGGELRSGELRSGDLRGGELRGDLPTVVDLLGDPLAAADGVVDGVVDGGLSADLSADLNTGRAQPTTRPGPLQRRATSAPIYYRLPDTPEGHHIKEYASGLRQLVRFVGVEEQVVKYSLS